MEPTEKVVAEGTLTILFTDLEGSTDLRSRVGDDVANELILAHEELIRSKLDEAGALEHKALGDGFMILFSSANQGIKAAVSIQRAIEEYNREHADLPIKVRMGLNSGDVTQHSGDAYGTAVHAAARIAAKAQAGQILIPQIVRDLAGMRPEFRVADRGLFWLKGFPDRWRLFEVLWRHKWEGSERSQERAAVPTETTVDLDLPRAQGPIVGRKTELAAVRAEVSNASAGALRAVVLEGEAGIGKTRIMEAAGEHAAGSDPSFWELQVAADEELRGPFLLFRSLIGDPRVSAIAREAMALEPLERARVAIGGRSSAETEGLSPQEARLRVFEEVASALSALAHEKPIALLFDDLQWADEDSIHLIRYLVRTLASLPILLLITIRPYSDSLTSGTENLIADLERMHLAQRMRLDRFARHETAELLNNLLGSPVADATLDSLHARAEGVPFFIEEFARAYREEKVLQLIDGTWTMTRLSGPSVPASVQSLIARRLGQHTEEARRLLSDAAVVGRRFRLSELADVIGAIERSEATPIWELDDKLQAAVDFGIVARLPDESDYDYMFTHDQIRAALIDSSSRHRAQAIHGAIVDMLSAAEGPENLSALAHHALRAGDEKRAVSYSIRAAQAGLDAHAPEESIRIIEAALPAASAPEDRIGMLRVKDDALTLLERGRDRMANLAEMGALAGALTDPSVELEVKLRRASAARMAQDFEAAEDVARGVREAAHAAGDSATELDACLELGQAITHSPLGEGYWPLVEIDHDAADEAFTRALELAREVGDRSKEAAALRERAVLAAGRAKQSVMVEAQKAEGMGELFGFASNELGAAKELADQAYQIYEELGDRRGAMSALISIAYAHVADPTPRGMAGRLEHVRRLHHSRNSAMTDSQRAADDALMLYSIHVFGRANLHVDLALERGRQAFEAARSIGDRWLESLAAGGLAMTFASLDEPDEAEAWVDRAAAAAMADPRPALAYRMEMWRGMCAAAHGNGDGLVEHLERAGELAAEQGNLAGRCEAAARLALESAKLGLAHGDPELLAVAEQAAAGAREAGAALPRGLPWDSMAHAVTALVAHEQGRTDEAADAAREALEILQPRMNPTHYFDVLWAAGRVLISQDEPEAAGLIKEINEDLEYLDATIVDLDVKSRWFSVPMTSQLVEMAGYEPSVGDASWVPLPEGVDQADLELLRSVNSGSDDGEIAEQLRVDPDEVGERVSQLLDKLGVPDRAAAIELAIKAGIA
jgi:predicted ATPase/class 3 adenylate cyclase